MKLYVVRHGQTDYNIQGRFQGRVDTELNVTGVEQIKNLKYVLGQIKFDTIFVSPLKRAINTAKILTNDQNFIIDQRLIERSFGDLEGKFSIPNYDSSDNLYGIESIDKLQKRVNSFLDELKVKNNNQENILIVTHEAVAQCINAYFNNTNNVKDFRLPTGSYVLYQIIDEEKLMKDLEDIELSRRSFDLKPQKVEKSATKNSKLHIVYLMVWTKVCGGSKIILEYANRLSKKGHKITIISYDKKPSWFDLDSNIEFIQVPEKQSIEDNIPDCDIIIPTSWKNIYQAVNSKKAPVTFFEQGGSHLFEVENLSQIKLDTIKQRFLLPPFIHTVSTYSKNKLFEIYGRDSKVICNAIDSTIFFPRESFETNTDIINITIIGSEDFKFKNINETLEGIRALKKIYKNINLNWITQDPPKMNKEKAIVNPTQVEIGDTLRKTDIFICNSEYESFCLPVLEAMTCGAATITTDNGGIRDFVIDNFNALIINKHDLTDLISKVEFLINNSEQRKRIMINGVETAKKFNWESSVRQMEIYYKYVASHRII